MWTYAPWQGRYLPHPLSPRERLSAYATWCNAVEGNTTFYATPTIETVRSWAEQTDPDFRFILKLPKPITHERRLADVDDPAARLPVRDRAARAAGARDLDPAAALLRPGRPRRPGRLPASAPARAPVLRRGPPSRVLRGRAIRAAARAGSRVRRRRMGDVRHHRPVLQPAGQRRRAGGVDEEAAAAPPVAGPHRRARRPLHRPGRQRADHRRMAAVARRRRRLAAGGTLPDRLHPHARQRRCARAGPSVPRRRSGPSAGDRASPRAHPDRAADAVLSTVRGCRRPLARSSLLRPGRTSGGPPSAGSRR